MLAALLTLGSSASWLFYNAIRSEHEAAINRQLHARLSWIEASIEMDETDLEFEPQREASAAAEFWAIHDKTDKPLWQSAVQGASDPDIRWISIPLNIKATSKSSGAKLTLRAGTSTRAMSADLDRTRRRLFLFGPAAFLCFSLAVVLLIRWQLKPLSRIADAAHAINAETSHANVHSGGTAPEYRALEESLNGMIHRLAEGIARERLFAASAAHELRTPLAQMRMGIEVALRKQRDTTEYREVLNQSLEDVDRLQSLIESLLLLSRPMTAGTPTTTPAAIIQSVRSQHPDLALPADTTHHSLEIHGEASLLLIALNNLIDNARRYGGNATPPEMTLEVEPRQITFCISDHGPGVAEADRQRIFEPLVRLDAARTITDDQQGFGLGLAIARQIAERFDGRLACRSRADGQPGATFTLTLPRA